MKLIFSIIILIVTCGMINGCASIDPEVGELTKIDIPEPIFSANVTLNVYDKQLAARKTYVQLVENATVSLLSKTGFALGDTPDFTIDSYVVNVDYPIQVLLDEARTPLYVSSTLIVWAVSPVHDPDKTSFSIVTSCGKAGLGDSFVGNTMMKISIEKALRENLKKGMDFITHFIKGDSVEETESLLLFSPAHKAPSSISIVNLKTEKVYQIIKSSSGLYYTSLPKGIYSFSKMDYNAMTYYQEDKEISFFDLRFEINEANKVYYLENDTFLKKTNPQLTIFQQLMSISPRFRPIVIHTFTEGGKAPQQNEITVKPLPYGFGL